MFQSTLQLAILILTTISLSARCAPQSCASIKETETPMFLNLRGYLANMAVKLDCYFTFEEGPGPDTIANVKDFVRDVDIETIDALVTHLDGQLEGVQVVRSTKHPNVVHLILEDLLQEGYVMDETVNVQYEGLLALLPDHLGTLLDQEIKARTWGDFREAYEWDCSTEVDVNGTNEVVRDVLSGAIPLEGYRRFLWEARRIESNESPAMLVRFYGRLPGPDNLIGTLEEYLLEMGKRLGCYFTIEDRPDPEPQDDRFIIHRGEFIVDLEITTIDALVEYLDEQLEGVQVVRSTKHPSVVHLIAADLLQEGYAMDETVTFEFEGPLDHLPYELQTLHDGKIQCASDAARDVFPNIHGGAGIDPEVQVAVVDETFRNLLTGAVPLEGHTRVLWLSVRAKANGTSKVWVAYYGLWDDENGDPED